MTRWEKIRTGLLALAAVATIGVVARIYFSDESPAREPVPLALPDAAPFPGWKRLPRERPPYRAPESRAFEHAETGIIAELQSIPDLPTHYVGDPELQERYLHRGEIPLEPGLRFTANSRGVIVPNARTDPPALATIEPQDDGSAFWKMQGRLHLSTLLTAGGGAGCSRPALSRRMFFTEVRAAQLGGWLLGRTLYPDRRCLLVHLSRAEDARHGGNARDDLRAALAAWRAWLTRPAPASAAARGAAAETLDAIPAR